MMRSIFGFFLVLLTAMPQVSAQLNSYSRAELAFDNALSGSNPGFESGTVKWTASGGTFAVNSGTQFVPGSKQFASWDSNSASQEVCSSLVIVPESGNCSVGLEYRVPSGTATHKIVAKDGSKDLAVEDVVSSTSAMKHEVEFPCAAAASNQARVCLRSVASNEPAIQFDSGYAGYARNVGVADLITEWEAWTPSSSWTGTITYTGFKRQVGTNQEIKFRIATGGAPTGSALTLNIPSECVIDTAKVTGNNARNPLGNLLIFDSDTGANIYGTIQGNNTTSVALNVILTGNASTAPIGQIGATTPITFANGDTIDGYFSVPCVGWTASTVVTPDAQGWWAGATFTAGSSVNLGTTSAAKNEIDASNITLAADSGSAPIGVVCASGNASPVGGTTCSAGNEVMGATVNIPRSGQYDVCFSATNYIEDGSSSTNMAVLNSFHMDYTSPTSDTAITAGVRNSFISYATGSGTGVETIATGFPFTHCETFTLPAGQVAFRMKHTSTITGTVANNNLQPGAGMSRISIRPVTGQQQAILANSVISNVSNGIRVEAASIDNTGTATIVRQTGSWITSVSRTGAGVVEVNYNASLWSVAPMCTLTINAATLIARVESITTTRLTTRMITSAGTSTDNPFYVTCIGPR